MFRELTNVEMDAVVGGAGVSLDLQVTGVLELLGAVNGLVGGLLETVLGAVGPLLGGLL